MTTTKFRVKFGNMEIELEGDQEYIEKKFGEVMEQLESSKLQPTAAVQQTVSEVSRESDSLHVQKVSLDGIIEYSNSKPHLAISSPSTKLSLSEVIALFLYAYGPTRLTMQDLKRIVSENWKSVEMTSLGATMANTLKGRVIKDGIRGKYLYTLSGSGKDFVVTKILPKLRNENS